MREKFKHECTVFAVCWLTYVITYLCRVNFSSAMLKLSQVMQVNTTQLGTIGSSFFVVYAVGQLVNGYIGDKISPYKLVAAALFGTGALNLAIACIDGYLPLMVLWTLNGYFQSMLWGPLMRILSQHISPSRTVWVSTGMSTSMVVGYITSWVLFGRCFLPRPWQTYFLVPALLALAAAVVWTGYLICRRKPAAAVPDAGASVSRQSRTGMFRSVVQYRLWLVAVVCLCMGLIKESLSLWSPMLMTEMLGLEEKTSLTVVALIPLANFAGILLTGRFMGKRNDAKRTLRDLFFAAALCSLCLFFTQRHAAAGGVAALAAISGLMYGCNSLLLSYLPISFGGENIVSSLVGLFDFSSYMGAALSSALLGVALEHKSYTAVFTVWLIVLCAACLLTQFFKLKPTSGPQKPECARRSEKAPGRP